MWILYPEGEAASPPAPHRSYWPAPPFLWKTTARKIPRQSYKTGIHHHHQPHHLLHVIKVGQKLKNTRYIAKTASFSMVRKKEWDAAHIRLPLKPTTCSFLCYWPSKEIFLSTPEIVSRRYQDYSPLSAAFWPPQRPVQVSVLPGSLSPPRWSAHAARRWGAPSLASLCSAPPENPNWSASLNHKGFNGIG